MPALLACLALFFLPFFPLLGGIFVLLLALWKKPGGELLPLFQGPILTQRELLLLKLLALTALVPFMTAQQPLYHAAGFLSHYLLPAGLCLLLLRKVRQGLLSLEHLEHAALAGLGVLALIALANYGLNWHGHWRGLQLPWFDHPYLIDLSLSPAQGRAHGPALNPNLLGLLMALGLPLAVARLCFYQDWLRRWYMGSLLLLLLGAWGVSFSRAAWLGGLAALFWLLRERHLRAAVLWILLGSLAGATLPLFQHRLLTLFQAEHRTNWLRQEIWSTGWNIFKDFPFTGIGILNLELYYPAYQVGVQAAAHLHMIPLQLVVESGLIFALLLYLLLFSCLRQTRVEIQAAGVALLVFGCFDAPLADLRVQALLMVLLVLALGARAAVQKNLEEGMGSPRERPVKPVADGEGLC